MAQHRKIGNTVILPNGDLKITANNEARRMIADGARSYGYNGAEQVVGELLHELYEFVRPEDIGALTDAPILCGSDDCYYADDGEFTLHDAGNVPVYWFPDYCIRDPWEELRSKGYVIFSVVNAE